MTVQRHDVENCTEDNCFACKCATIAFGAAATPGRRAATIEKDRFATKFDNDCDAYRRLRKNGLQPKATKDAAIIEKTADSEWEVETGMRLPSAKIGTQFDRVQSAVMAGEFTA